MTKPPQQPVLSPPSEDATPSRPLARRLAAAGMSVQVSRHRDTCELTIVGAATGKSLLALSAGGQARWYYEPAAGPLTSPATLTTIIGYLLQAPHPTTTLATYRTLPLKGQVGRALQDQGLTVALRVSEDLDSFEATTDIDITSPTHPQLGIITMSDDAALDWHLNWPKAFHGNPVTLIDMITPILRDR
jgi:hypothetical protein